MAARTAQKPSQTTSTIRSALRALELERTGLQSLEATLAEGGSFAVAFERAVALIRAMTGRAIVTGIGKSGIVARKLAATLASTGTPASFVHAAEANHGDLGMIQAQDVVIALSWSGESAELAATVNYVKRFRIPLIAFTAKADSALGREADVALELPESPEACPHGLAPTTSTTMLLALGDALAMALLEGRGFSARDFSVFHPGGKLGAKLALVRDVMHQGERVPRILAESTMGEAIMEMTSKGLGCVAVQDEGGMLKGIITDGDLRRHLKEAHLLDAPVESVMTKRPRTIQPDALVAEALEAIAPLSVLLVVEKARVVGIVHVNDLLRVGAA